MSEPTIEELTAEVTTLRSVKDELLTKTHAQKATITALEAERNALSEQATKATEAVRKVVIDQPVRQMIQQLCPAAPDLLQRELESDYTFDADENGSIIVKTKTDGKPVLAKDGKPVPFERYDFHKFIIGDGYASKNARQTMYAHLVKVPAASGGSNLKVRQGRGESEKEVLQKPVFGLR